MTILRKINWLLLLAQQVHKAQPDRKEIQGRKEIQDRRGHKARLEKMEKAHTKRQ